jgi:hypothetical protein
MAQEHLPRKLETMSSKKREKKIVDWSGTGDVAQWQNTCMYEALGSIPNTESIASFLSLLVPPDLTRGD